MMHRHHTGRLLVWEKKGVLFECKKKKKDVVSAG